MVHLTESPCTQRKKRCEPQNSAIFRKKACPNHKNIKLLKSSWNWHHWKEHKKLSIFHVRTFVWKWTVGKIFQFFSDHVTIFGHLGPKTHFLTYLGLKSTTDSGWGLVGSILVRRFYWQWKISKFSIWGGLGQIWPNYHICVFWAQNTVLGHISA